MTAIQRIPAVQSGTKRLILTTSGPRGRPVGAFSLAGIRESEAFASRALAGFLARWRGPGCGQAATQAALAGSRRAAFADAFAPTRSPKARFREGRRGQDVLWEPHPEQLPDRSCQRPGRSSRRLVERDRLFERRYALLVRVVFRRESSEHGLDVRLPSSEGGGGELIRRERISGTAIDKAASGAVRRSRPLTRARALARERRREPGRWRLKRERARARARRGAGAARARKLQVLIDAWPV
jgi:hypothetical protein